MRKLRYPGAQPFSQHQAEIFFGRESEVDVLATQIQLEPLTVLYGKSGLGKSSLINAGLLPMLEKQKSFQTLTVRFFPANNQAGKAVSNTAPITKTIETVLSAGSEELPVLDQLIAEDNSLWKEVKKYLARDESESKGLLLVFDQFEELFTYSKSEILSFKQQLAEALYTPVPQRYWDALDRVPNDEIDQNSLVWIQSVTALNVLFSIRSDRFHLLERLDDYLPSVLQNCVELGPLNLIDARQAIVKPACLEGPYRGSPFTYTSDALGDILGFLTRNGTKSVESTQLQIVCDHLDRRLQEENRNHITTRDTSDLPSIIADYYQSKLKEIKDDGERNNARLLIEDQLIFVEEERRLSMYSGQVLRQISASTLQILVDGHLLRAEPNLEGGYDYELSHDTLVVPILEARTERHRKEQLAAERMLKEERAAERKAARRKLLLAYLIALVGITLAALSFYFAQSAREAKRDAEQTLYARSVERVRSLKLDGRYSSALAELGRLNNLANNLGFGPIHQKQVDSLQRLYELNEKAKNYSSDSLFYRLESYERALAFSPDAYLVQRVASLRAELEENIRKEKDLLRSALLARDRQEIDIRIQKLRLLAPGRSAEIDGLVRQYGVSY